MNPERDYLFTAIQRKHSIRRYAILSFLSLVFLVGVVWIGLASFRELKTPTLQVLSSIRLLEYASVFGNDAQQIATISKAEKERIYIWPKDGVEIDFETVDFPISVWKILEANYPKDIPKLSTEEKELLLSFTLPIVQEEISRKIEDEHFLDSSMSASLLAKTENQTLATLPKYISFSRYKWLGYSKILYYIIVKDSYGRQKVVFASVSDAADKTAFLGSISFPLCVIILTVFCLLAVNISSYQKQRNLYRLESRLFSANSFAELVRIVYEEFARLNLDISSLTLQVLHDGGFTLYYAGTKEEMPRARLVPMDKESPSFKRLKDPAKDKPFIYESIYSDKKDEFYSLTVPIIEAEKKYAFTNFNFSKKGVGLSKVYFVHQAFSGIQTAFSNIYAVIEESKNQEWKEIKQWIFDRREESPDVLFRHLRNRLLFENDSFRLPKISYLEAILIKEDYFVNFFDMEEVISEPRLNDFPIQSKTSLLEKTKIVIISHKKTFHIFIPILIQAVPVFILVKIPKTESYLTFFTVDYLEVIFREYAAQVTYYYEIVLKDTIRDEYIYASTGLQEETKEIIDYKSQQFYESWDSSEVHSKKEIDERLRAWVNREKVFSEYGFGVFFELDVSRSSEIKKLLDSSTEALYETRIEETNEELKDYLESIENKFVTRNKSGGDGDGARFFFTAKNTRIGSQFSEKDHISTLEKEYYHAKLVSKSLEVLEVLVQKRIPAKLGYFPLESDSKMSMSIERGSFKIISYLQGLLDHSRCVKTARLDLQGNEIAALEPNFLFDGKLDILPLQVFQPWSLVLPTKLLSFIPEELKGQIQSQNFLLKNASDEKTGKPAEYSEVFFHATYSGLYRIFPELIQVPRNWNVPIYKYVLKEFLQLLRNSQDSTDTLLTEFSKGKKISYKGSTFKITKLEVLNSLFLDASSVRSKGIYMSLEQINPLKISKEDLSVKIENFLSEKIPHLERIHEKALQIKELQTQISNVPILDVGSFQEILGKSNRIFLENIAKG